MKQPFQNILNKCLYCIFPLVCLLAPACVPASVGPQALEGRLDLGAWNFTDSGPVNLSGQWEFYWRQFYQSTDFRTRAPDHGYIQTPQGWQHFGPQTNTSGYGTYRLRVTLPRAGEIYALYLPQLYTASELEVDGKLLSRMGRLGKTPEGTTPMAYPRIVEFYGAQREVEILVRISNFDFREGGIRKAVQLGKPKQIRARRERSLNYGLFLAGAYLLIGLYHLFAFAIRREDRPALFLGISCGTLGLRSLLTDEAFLFQTFPGAGYTLLLKLEYLTMLGATGAFLFLLHYLYQRDFPRKLIQIIGAVYGTLMLFTIFAPLLLVTRLLPFYLASILLTSALGLAILLLILYRRRPGIGLILFGTLFPLLGTLWDIFFFGKFLAIYAGKMGMLVFICTQAALVSLRHAAAYRTVRRLSGALRSRNVELKQMDKLKDEFLANTSHELRTPLNGIIGLADSLMGGAAGILNQTARQNLSLIVSSGKRLASLISDILDFQKIREHEIQLAPQAVDLHSLVEVVLAVSVPLTEGKNLQLKNTLPPDLPPVLADENRLQQILHNLVGNAIKFTQAGEIRVTARVQGELIETAIEDTGTGISPENQSRIFKSFEQGDASIEREYGGTGLGLSITRQLLELQGGHIRVESALGQGSKFFFTLPISQELPLTRTPRVPAPMEEPLTPNPTIAKTKPDEKIRGRIALVDDDPINLQVLRNQLTLNNFEVLEARNGDEALALLKNEPLVDLFLLDVMMPGLSGYDVCRILRESHSPLELPVLLLTAKSRTSDLVTGFKSGANDFLVKPFDASELLARVQTMVELKRAAKSQSRLAALEFEMDLARKIQQSLIPDTPPHIPGLKIAARYRTMESVGGDFYDFRPHENQLGLIMADVSGHGIPAALVVSMVHLAFWFQKQALPEPTGLFDNMNQILLNNIGNEFVTAAYILLDSETRKLTVSNAGHPPLLIRKKGQSQLIKSRPYGHILGLDLASKYEIEELQLEPGDRILLYTDGAYEVHNPEYEPFGKERLEDFIRTGDNLDAEQFADKLLETLSSWCAGEENIDDDIAFTVIDLL